MIKTNNHIGLKIKNSGLPFRVNKIKNSKTHLLASHIRKIFKNMNAESASYSRTEFNHQSLDLMYYTHFTSPIRRIIDTVIHYYITYHQKIRINLERLNFLDKQTKKFNRILQLKYNTEYLENKFIDTAYLYKIIYPNIWEIYNEKLGLCRLEMFNINLSYQFEFLKLDDTYIIKNKDNEYKYKIGDTINISIEKTPGYFPNEKIKILPIF